MRMTEAQMTEGERVPEAARTYIAGYLRRSADALQATLGDDAFHATVAGIAAAVERSMRAGGKLLLAGNGGSAGDAQHLAGEFLSRFCIDRAPLPAIALTTDTSVLTAIGNDYGYEQLFERQVRGLGRAGDVFLAISTSGRSPNILVALRAARDAGLTTIGFTGARENAMSALCDLCLHAPSDETPVIQQIHMVAGHMICGLVEQAMVRGGS
jgi:D-sedoheptulose 7-phosphate isomerase